MIIVTKHNSLFTKYNFENKKTVARCEVEDPYVQSIVWGFGMLAIVSSNSIIVVDDNDFERITVIREKFPIKSVCWES